VRNLFGDLVELGHFIEQLLALLQGRVHRFVQDLGKLDQVLGGLPEQWKNFLSFGVKNWKTVFRLKDISLFLMVQS
jgi:hypothetical protein